MKKLAALAVIPLFAGFLFAQATQETTTTTTTLNGTLVDAGCQTTHTEHKETNSTATSTTTSQSSRDTTDCPVTTTSTSFGLMTTDGKFVRLDDTGNQRVIEMVKGNKNWHTYITEKKPIKVRVMGTQNGDVVVVKEIK